MESAEQTGRAPRKLLARERRALQRLTQERFRGSSEASEKIVHQLQHRRQSLADVHQRDSTWPDMPSMWVLTHKAPTKRAKDIAC
jgi:selenocysteine lyase/cysteine desulfurase